jgi:hydrogenase nickel incorporation protein HypA/HybF
VHELSLCRSVYRIADGARSGRPVRTVHLRVGHLRQVVPATLEHCWSLVVAGTDLAGAALAVEHVPVTLDCAACAARTVLGDDPSLVCAACGSTEVRLRGGEELVVTGLDLAPRPGPGDTSGERD